MTAILPDFAYKLPAVVASGVGDSNPVGSIVTSLAELVDTTYLPCLGQAISRATYGSLFALIGTKYGVGDGTTTFNLPKFSPEIVSITPSTTPASTGACTSLLLPDGRIFVLRGGVNTYLGTLNTSNNTIAWVTSTALPTTSFYGAAFLLQDGRIVIAGGGDIEVNANARTTCYIGTVSGNTITWVLSTALPLARANAAYTTLSDGRLFLLGGGTTTTGNSDTTYFGTVSGNTITWVAGTVYPALLREAMAVQLPNGRIFVTGGLTQIIAYFGIISGNTITWVQTRNLPESKSDTNVILLPTGDVLTSGGKNAALNSRSFMGLISEADVIWTDLRPLPIKTTGLRGILFNNTTLIYIPGSVNTLYIISFSYRYIKVTT